MLNQAKGMATNHAKGDSQEKRPREAQAEKKALGKRAEELTFFMIAKNKPTLIYEVKR